jgi:hypothetical protein
MYNSTFNITDKLGNNTFKITWINGDVENIVIEDGCYEVEDLNQYLQKVMYKRGWYVVNTESVQNEFFISVQVNASKYKVELTTYTVPSQEKAILLKYILPPDADWNFLNRIDGANRNKQPIIELSDGLALFLGFETKRIFGNGNDDNDPNVSNWAVIPITFFSDTAPNVKPVFAYLVSCNLLENDLNLVDGLLSQLVVQGSIGSQMSDSSTNKEQLTCKSGVFSFIEIRMWSQDFEVLDYLDKNLSMTLLIETIQDDEDEYKNKNK